VGTFLLHGRLLVISKIKNTLRPYLPRNLRHTLRGHRERQFAHTHLFSANPAVVYLTWGEGREVLHVALEDRPLTLLYLFFCWLLPEEVVAMSQEIRKTMKRFPTHRIVMLCNEQFAVDIFRAEGVEAIFCNHNCLIDENHFTIDPRAVKKYDAIYNATMSGYKRHQLAAKIESLALITYRYSGTYARDYEKEVQACLAHGTWLADAHKDSEKASAREVAGYCNESRVGLCLSAREGAMFASIEYLLCGLPVVTTRNIGGRDAFFEPDYVEWVEDDADAVNAGLRRLLARVPAAALIRRRTIEKMEEHRQRLRDLLKNDVPEIQIPWKPGSIGPLTKSNLRELGRKLRQA
jgi:glycosyltransferase involved in cell wall biosynthesis